MVQNQSKKAITQGSRHFDYLHKEVIQRSCYLKAELRKLVDVIQQTACFAYEKNLLHAMLNNNKAAFGD